MSILTRYPTLQSRAYTDPRTGILQEVAIIVREDTHNKLLVHKESQGRRVTRANAATAVAALAKEKRLRRRLVVVYLPDSQGKKSKVKGSKKTKAM